MACGAGGSVILEPMQEIGPRPPAPPAPAPARRPTVAELEARRLAALRALAFAGSVAGLSLGWAAACAAGDALAWAAAALLG